MPGKSLQQRWTRRAILLLLLLNALLWAPFAMSAGHLSVRADPFPTGCAGHSPR